MHTLKNRNVNKSHGIKTNENGITKLKLHLSRLKDNENPEFNQNTCERKNTIPKAIINV